MLKTIVTVIFLISVVNFTSTEEVKSFIIGGRDAVAGQFPHFASLRYGDELWHGCGGAIITSRWILSAAHCFYSSPPVEVLVGSVKIDEGTRYGIAQSIMHPEFPPTIELIGHNYSNWHDIGLVNLAQNIIFTNLVQPIRLVRRRVIGNSRASVAGFGLSYLNRDWTVAEVPDTLQFIQTDIITNTECKVRTRLFGVLIPTPIIYSGHICVQSPRSVGTCFGDSGSPLITREGVVGVVVSGVLPCARGAPDIFVRVSTYYRWIASHIDSLP